MGLYDGIGGSYSPYTPRVDASMLRNQPQRSTLKDILAGMEAAQGMRNQREWRGFEGDINDEAGAKQAAALALKQGNVEGALQIMRQWKAMQPGPAEMGLFEGDAGAVYEYDKSAPGSTMKPIPGVKSKPKEFPPGDPLGKAKFDEQVRHNKAMEEIGRAAAGKGQPKPGQTKLSAAQSGTISDVSEANRMLNDLAGSFNQTGMAKSPGKSWAADAIESIPFIGGKLAPQTAEYNDKRRITAETFLRAATGAAAPAAEVKFYSGLLPQAGDNPKQAQSAINAFRDKITAKVKGISEALRLEGREEEAAAMDKRIDEMFTGSTTIEGAAPKVISSLPIKITTKAMRDSLPSGQRYIGPDGKEYIKK